MPGPGRPFQKGQPKLAGRRAGTPNRRTVEVRRVIHAVAKRLGGEDRLYEWVMESPENERVFWSSMYIKLLPVRIQGTGERGEIELSVTHKIERDELSKRLEERGLPVTVFGVDKPPPLH
jgi:hypothetical protein